jgi:DNA helicase-2/ATP-dependent DNA helicase PcrA
MSAVLSTLQPDQIDLVTRPAPENIILQGHPGTGKTVIAVHRAAFLLHSEYAQAFEENDIEAISKQPRSVLLIGPTNEWVTHVSSALRNLIDDERKFRVVSIAEFENELTGLKTWEGSVEANRLIDVSQELAEIVEFAISRTKSVTKRSYVSRKEVYKTLLDLPANPPAQGLYRDWVDYINGLPRSLSSLNSKRDLSLRPLLAYIGVRTSSTLNFKQFEHVVLDEAQDVYPIQWETLGRLGNPGGWTIVGDLNQRRTDHTYGSWEVVSDLLGLESDDMKPPITVLKVGYRSTSQIIKFADQLLPRNERVIQSVQQSGEKPKVIRETKVTEIPQRVLRETFEMIERVNGGTVAIITVLLDPISKLLVRGGWRKNAVGNSWEEGNRTIQLLTPDQARGIEFDGVVVTEPADFPENLGRSGVLYTSLTRANRLLTVVHNRALPRGMKREV